MKGTVGYVEKGRLGDYVCITNDVGGTTDLPDGRYYVEVTRAFYDYEAGTRCVGVLRDAISREIARQVGTTGYAKDGEVYEPTTVYFNAGAFTPESAVTA